MLKHSPGRFFVLARTAPALRNSAACDFKPFVARFPFVCMSILTSDVWNNEINIELLNILVHSRSKVEVFF